MSQFSSSMPPPRAPRRPEPLRRGAELALLVGVAGPVLWLGGAPPGAAVLAALCCAAALALLSASDRGSLTLPPLAFVPLAAAALCALQLVPLPPSLLAFVSPPMGELQSFALAPLGLQRWRPVSHDPSATALALAGALSAAAALVAAAGLSRSRRSRRLLAAGIGLTGVAVSLIGFGHALADAHSLFGIHRFQNGELAFLTPFGNPNHLAAFATLATALLLGLAADSESRSLRVFWLGAAVASGASAFLSLSRGGIAFWCAGQLAVVLLVLRRRQGRPLVSSRALPLVLAVGAVVLFAGYLAFDRLGSELATLDSVEKLRRSKVELWPMFSRPALAAWLTGVGRGTFELAFPRWQTAHSTLTFTFTHPENLVLQLATELGIPATLLLAAVAAWAVVKTFRADAPPVVLAAWAGVGALVLHDLFDFALELPACATAAAIALGISSGPWEEQGRPRLAPSRAVPALAVAALVVILALVRAGSTAAAAESQLAASVAPKPALAFRDEARSLVDRHPADAVLYRLAGWTEATRPGGQPRLALAWLNRALFLRPLDPDTHRVVARALFQLGASRQALVEERLALESGAESATVLAESLPRAHDVDSLWALVGDTPAHVDLLVMGLWAKDRRNDARAILDRAVDTFEGRPEAAALDVTAARVRLDTGDAAGALELLDQAERAGQEVAQTRADALVALGRRREAIQVLESAIARHPADSELAFALARNWLAENKPALARAALERLKPFLSGSGQRTQLLLAQAETYRVEGRAVRALDLVQNAVRLAPTDAGLHRQAAELYEAMQRPQEALREVEAAVRVSEAPADVATVAWMARLREASEAATIRALEDRDRGLWNALEPADGGVQPRRAGKGR